MEREGGRDRRGGRGIGEVKREERWRGRGGGRDRRGGGRGIGEVKRDGEGGGGERDRGGGG